MSDKKKDFNQTTEENKETLKDKEARIEELREKLESIKSLQKPSSCEISKDGAPETCSIDTAFRPDRPGIKSERERLEDEPIEDTYGYNIRVSPETRERILKELKLQEESHPIPDDTEVFVKILENGPYEVVGDIPISDIAIKTNQKGQSIGWDKDRDLKGKIPVLLCRCGASKHMPFCDEMHLKIDFDGTLTASNKPYNESASIYKGCQGVYLMDEESLCAIVRFCDPDGSCWNLVKNAQTEETAYEQTCNCASGRLTIVKDGKKLEPKFDKEIECIYDTERDVLGPLYLKGYIPVKSKETDYELRNRITLCRCGRSENKPFCDGMHLTCPKLNQKEIEEND